MIFKHCEWALLSLSLQTHEWHEEFKFWPHFFQLCRVVNCNGKSQRSSNEDELFHRKYDKASNNFSRGKWRNTVGVVSGLVREENKKRSSHGLFYNFTKYSNIWQLYLHRIGLEFSLQVFKWLFVNKRSSHRLQVAMLQKETFMNDFQSHANLTSMFDVYSKAFKRRLAFGTLKLFLLESLWIEHSSMVKMRRAARAAVGSGREVAKMREGILAGRNRDCCCVIWFNDSKALRHFFLVTTSRIRDKKKLPSGRRRNIASWSRKRQDLRAPDGNWGHKSLPFVFALPSS